jgi:hypothetical protein
MPPSFTIVGRSSSHFTRVVRLFALELEVPHGFEVVSDLRSLASSDYADNPALRLPILKTDDELWFGSLAICRTLACHARVKRDIVWPEQLLTPLLSNAQELTLQAMSTEVELLLTPLLSNAQELTLQAMSTEVELLMGGDAAGPSFADKPRQPDEQPELARRARRCGALGAPEARLQLPRSDLVLRDRASGISPRAGHDPISATESLLRSFRRPRVGTSHELRARSTGCAALSLSPTPSGRPNGRAAQKLP